MLDLAIKYQDKLKELFASIVFEDKYKWYTACSYYDEYKPDNSTWNRHEFVSMDKDKNILGYIKYGICRDDRNCHSLQIINFSDNKVVFGRDVIKCLDGVFSNFQFNKLSFCVVVGNPIERSYDRLVKKYGGRIVGTKVKDCMLMDGNYYDIKLYEILKEDYLGRKEKINDTI